MLPNPLEEIARKLDEYNKRLSHLERLEGGIWHFIEEIVLTAPATIIDFQNIPGNFRHLWIFYNARGDFAGDRDGFGIRFNADAGNNYDSEIHDVTAATVLVGSGADGPGTAFIRGPTFPASTAPANYVGSGKILIPYYSKTDFYKTLIAESHHIIAQTLAGILSGQVGGSWRNTAAITRVQLFPFFGAANLVANSRAVLYGLL